MVAKRSGPKTVEHELSHGIPIFLDQLIETLTLEQASGQLRNRVRALAQCAHQNAGQYDKPQADEE